MTSTEAAWPDLQTPPADLDAWIPTALAAINRRLTELAPSSPRAPWVLSSAVHGALLGRGKRVRPLLALLSAAHSGGDWQAALDFSCATEMVHAASLVLDDLPCMDNAAMRRGRPALHRAFGEDAAVLSAVALLNQAYGVIAGDDGLPSHTRLMLQGLISDAVGFEGLVTGQMRDLRDEESTRTEASLASLNHQKTGVLFVAAASGGAAIAGAQEIERKRAAAFASKLGLAFQLWDDLQDVTATIQVTGKDAGKDAGRTTFASLWGADRARAAVDDTLEAALDALGDRDGPLPRYALRLFRHARQSV